MVNQELEYAQLKPKALARAEGLLWKMKSKQGGRVVTNRILGSLIIILLTIPIHAQESNIGSRALGFGIELPTLNLGMLGYFPIPDTDLLGFGIGSVALVSTSGLDNYYDHSETYAGVTLGDSKQGTKIERTTIGAGIGFDIKSSMKLLGGLGITFEDEYAEYYDPFEILSSDGHYWVNGDGGRSSKISFVGGVVFNLGHPQYEIYSLLTFPTVGVQGGVCFKF
jgi:hypothetical protein